MRFKKTRLGPLLIRSAEDPGFFRQTHVLFGGTGAVGGATALQMIGALEEALGHPASRSADAHGAAEAGEMRAAPRLVVTGRSHQEVRRFTSLLFSVQQRDHDGAKPSRVPGVGYRTVAGVEIQLLVFGVDPHVPGIEGFARRNEEERRQMLRELLTAQGLPESSPVEDKIDLLQRLVRETVQQPFSQFLERYREGAATGGEADSTDRSGGADRSGQADQAGGAGWLSSVVVGIPLASIATYKLNDLEEVAGAMGLAPESPRMGELKTSYLMAIRDDLAAVNRMATHGVLVAHTTAVGGMYDEETEGHRTIRLGFAHSSLGEKLRQKQAFAEELARLYAESGIKMLVTAAAIGVDAVSFHRNPPLNRGISLILSKARAAGSELVPAADLDGGVKVYEPVEIGLSGEHEPTAFRHGFDLVAEALLKSGENGFFTVSDTEALYRVMRVTTTGELGLLLARAAIFGDDPAAPSFPDNLCYYTESDYSRQVFDLLDHPRLVANQIAGLSPKALQDLGSAKHQGELHTLGLLILLHRLRTLDLDAIPRHVDLSELDPRAFFEAHSRPLLLERLLGWTLPGMERDLRTLVRAREERDLAPLKHFFQPDPDRQEAAHRVLREVIHAVWAIPSLGTPILWEDEEGRPRVLAGPYVAPLDLAVTHHDSLGRFFETRFREHYDGPAEDYDHFVEFHIANGGFLDLRPRAVLVTAHAETEDLGKKVQVFHSEEAFREALGRIEPYTYFTTSGLIALLTWLQGLAHEAERFDLRLGSANEYRAQYRRDAQGRALLVPGVIEARRMVAQGLEKNTGLERLDGPWGYPE